MASVFTITPECAEELLDCNTKTGLAIRDISNQQDKAVAEYANGYREKKIAEGEEFQDFDEAHCFLNALGGPTHVFQMIPEAKGCAVRPHIIEGHLDRHKKALARANRQGAGIFVCVNRAEGGRRKEHVKQIRSLFLDLDGSPLDPVLNSDLRPDMVTETSPGRFHCFWLTNTLPLSEYRAAQMKLIEKFNGDPACKDLGRCTRVAGYLHKKHEPFMTRIIHINEGIAGYA